MNNITSSFEPVVLTHQWNWGLIVLSFFLATLGTVTSLKVLKQRTSDYGKRNFLLLILASTSLSSVGLYSMTIVAVLSLSFNVPDNVPDDQVQYNIGLAVLCCFSTCVAGVFTFLVCPKHYAHLSLASSDLGDSITPNLGPLFKQFFGAIRSWFATLILAGEFILCHFIALYSQQLPMPIGTEYDSMYLGWSVVVSLISSMLCTFVIFALPLIWRRNIYIMTCTSMFLAIFLCLVQYLWLNSKTFLIVDPLPAPSGPAPGSVPTNNDNNNNNSGSTSTGLIDSSMVLEITVPASIVCCLAIIGLFMYRRYRFLVQENTKVNSLLLSALIFDSEGKQILMSPVTNTPPSVEIVKHYEKKGNREFNQVNADFLQLLHASFHWKDLDKLARNQSGDALVHHSNHHGHYSNNNPFSPSSLNNNSTENKNNNNSRKKNAVPSSRNPASSSGRSSTTPTSANPTNSEQELVSHNRHDQSRTLFRAFARAVNQMAQMLHCTNHLSQLGILYWKPLEGICILVLKASPEQMKHFQSTTEFKFQVPEQLNDWVVQRAQRRLNSSPTPAAQFRSLLSGLLSSPRTASNRIIVPTTNNNDSPSHNNNNNNGHNNGHSNALHHDWIFEALQYYEAIHVPLIGYNLPEKLNSWLMDLAGELLLTTDMTFLESTVQSWRSALGIYVNSVLHLKQLVLDDRQWDQIELHPMVKAKIRLILLPPPSNPNTPPARTKHLLNPIGGHTSPSASTTSILAPRVSANNNNNVNNNHNIITSHSGESFDDYASYNLHSLSSYYLAVYSVHVRPLGLEVLLPHAYGPLTFLPMVKLDSSKFGISGFNLQHFAMLKRFASQSNFAQSTLPKFCSTMHKLIERQKQQQVVQLSTDHPSLEVKSMDLQGVDSAFMSFLDQVASGAEELNRLFEHEPVKPICTLSTLSDCHVVHLKPDIHVLLFVNLLMVGPSSASVNNNSDQQNGDRLHIQTHELSRPSSLYSYVPLPVFEIITYSFLNPMHQSNNWTREIIKKFHAADQQQQQQQQQQEKMTKIHLVNKPTRSASVVQTSVAQEPNVNNHTNQPIQPNQQLEKKRAHLAQLAHFDDQITNRITWNV